ncbi:enoyl-CoA hydratase/isomerase family protein [Amycolatopsis sp. NPDC051903]|uniref:enoyl-CoA hydratase/isomerase family protein n=1 Tax=Amycolatopsis sp. NPDC051903 TaxID=3363936 RepID=UPI00379666C5
MSTTHWHLHREGAVTSIRFARPPAHDLRFADLRALRTVLAEVGADETVSVVILGCAEEGRFLGHAEPAEIAAVRSGELPAEVMTEWLTTLLAIEDLPQPVIAAIEGPARGGGHELALACTFRLAGPGAVFQQHEIDRAAMPGAGATQRLPRLIGPGRAARMIMTGRPVDAGEAARIGLADEVLTGPDLRGQVLARAATLARKPRRSLVAIKQALLAAGRLPLQEGLQREQELFLDVLGVRPDRPRR